MSANIIIETSKTGHSIPRVNGVYLHSTLDPIKEAIAFAHTQIARAEKTSAILVLGLGFAYHIDELIKQLKTSNKTYSITVVEPNKALVQTYLDNINSTPSFQIISNNDVIKLYQENTYIDFLKLKPVIISHNNSFNANKTFFSTLLSYRASLQMQDYIDKIDDASFRNYLIEQCAEADSLHQVTDRVASAREINRNDKLLLAFSQIIGTTTRSGEASQ